MMRKLLLQLVTGPTIKCLDYIEIFWDKVFIVRNFHLPLIKLWRRSLCSNLGGIGAEKLY